MSNEADTENLLNLMCRFNVHSLNIPFGKITGSRARAREPLNNEVTPKKINSDDESFLKLLL